MLSPFSRCESIFIGWVRPQFFIVRFTAAHKAPGGHGGKGARKMIRRRPTLTPERTRDPCRYQPDSRKGDRSRALRPFYASRVRGGALPGRPVPVHRRRGVAVGRGLCAGGRRRHRRLRCGARPGPAPNPGPGVLGDRPQPARAAESLPTGRRPLLRASDRHGRAAAPGAPGGTGGGDPHRGGGRRVHRRPSPPVGGIHGPNGAPAPGARALRPHRVGTPRCSRPLAPERLGPRREPGCVPPARRRPPPFHELSFRRPLPLPLHTARLGPPFPGDAPARPRERQGLSSLGAGGQRRDPPLQDQVGRPPGASL
jgi:hypothetical protein